MTLRSLALALAAAVAASTAQAGARGETSLPAQRTIAPPPPPALVAHAPRWWRTVAFADPLYADAAARRDEVAFRPDNGFPRDPPVVVAGGGLVFAAVGSRTCSLDDASGELGWCTPGAAWRLALGHGEVVAIARGVATAYAATTGRRRWTAPAQSVTTSAYGFVLAGRGAADGRSTYAEVSPAGQRLWQAAVDARVDAQPVVIGPRTMLQHAFTDGARFGDPLYRVRSGAGGGIRPLPVEGAALLAARGDDVFTYGGWHAHEAGDSIVTFDVDVTDVRNATALQSWHYEPDYDANRRAYGEPKSLYAGRLQSKWAAAEGDVFYAAVLDRLYRYRLADPAGQEPLLIATGGRWIGGPYGGTLLIDRPDGLWTVRAEGRRTREVRAVPHDAHAEVAALAVSDGYAYAALTDGAVAAFALRDGRRAIDARVPCRSYRGAAVGSNSVLLVCTSTPAPRVYAFARLRPAR